MGMIAEHLKFNSFLLLLKWLIGEMLQCREYRYTNNPGKRPVYWHKGIKERQGLTLVFGTILLVCYVINTKKLGVKARSKIWGSVTYSVSEDRSLAAALEPQKRTAWTVIRWTLAATVWLLRGCRVGRQSGSGRSCGNRRVGLKCVWHLVANDVHQAFKSLLDVDVVLCACLKKLKSFLEREIGKYGK